MIVSSVVHAYCHCVGLRWSFVARSEVSSSISDEFFLKNFILNFSRFSWGMGLRIRIVWLQMGVVGLASRALCGICKCIGKWSELSSVCVLVVDVYSSLLGVLM